MDSCGYFEYRHNNFFNQVNLL